MTLTLPLPPKSLHPNARAHWAEKMRSRKKCRSEAALVARPLAPSEPWEKATVQATFYLARKNDGDNLNAWLKSAIDGIADAGFVVNDSGITLLPPLQVTGKGLDYRVELSIERDA